MREVMQNNSKYNSKNNVQYPQIQPKHSDSPKKTKNEVFDDDNPFLKKHISNQSYHPPTFKEKDFKEYDVPK